MTTATPSFLIVNGEPLTSVPVPTVTSLLESTTGAYTTTRTHGSVSLLLFWDRHLRRLHHSIDTLARFAPHLLGSAPTLDNRARDITADLHKSLHLGLALAFSERHRALSDAEIAVTALARSRRCGGALDVLLHLGFYSPSPFGSNGAHLAVAGPGRGTAAAAKYSSWARDRKKLEKMKPPAATELLLSNDGDRILEGSITNFFVVCRKSEFSYEVQTAPVGDGVLPGVIRQLVIEACSTIGIPFQEVAPSWADRGRWAEAFITSSLRIVQHVETIQVPISCEKLQQKTWEDVSWAVKRFEGAGVITTQIQKEIVSRAVSDGYPLTNVIEECHT